MSAEFGIMGLGVMGKSLCLNLANKGFHLALYNRRLEGVEEDVADQFIEQHPSLKNARGYEQLAAFVKYLEVPRKILLMVPAGKAVDQLIEQLIPKLSPGDILIDGGNSHYKETQRRIQELHEHQIHFIGAGISGGEEGALKGPSIMPGGNPEAYALVSRYLENIAARDQVGKACCAYIGPDGAGHFVKMVHNGIEYAEMQLLTEVYSLFRFGQGKNPDQIAEILESWKSQGLNSYLLEITVDILRRKEENDWLLDKVLDQAANKGTGSWTTVAASELGVPATMITAALFARYLSSFKQERLHAEEAFAFSTHKSGNGHELAVEDIRFAYQTARIINHHQGFQLIQAAAQEYAWQLNLAEIARIWTNGCIIRSDLMEKLAQSRWEESNLLLQSPFKEETRAHSHHLGQVVSEAVFQGIPLPCMAAAIQYLQAYVQGNSAANLIQAQRDYFGAHTYQRIDDPSRKAFHSDWKGN